MAIGFDLLVWRRRQLRPANGYFRSVARLRRSEEHLNCTEIRARYRKGSKRYTKVCSRGFRTRSRYRRGGQRLRRAILEPGPIASLRPERIARFFSQNALIWSEPGRSVNEA